MGLSISSAVRRRRVAGHQPVDLVFGLHDRAHVVVKRKAHAALLEQELVQRLPRLLRVRDRLCPEVRADGAARPGRRKRVTRAAAGAPR